MHPANSEGICLPSCGLDTEQWNRESAGALLAQPPKGNEKGRSGERPMGTMAYGGKGQGKGKGSREKRIGLGRRGRTQGGERPIGQ